MKRQIALIITLFQLFGTAGIPVVAFSCVDCDEGGVIPYSSWAEGSCYADACCGGDLDVTNAQIESSTACCQIDNQVSTENNGVLIPAKKHKQYGLFPLVSECPGASPLATTTAMTTTSLAIFHPPINRPLII